MGIYAFCLFVTMFGFPNRLIVVPLSIIIISIRFDPYFVTFLIPCKLICNLLQLLAFTLDTHTYVSLYTIFSPHFYFACWWQLCTFTVLSNHWYLDILSSISQLFNICVPEPQQYHFFMFLCLWKTCFILFISLTTSIFILF